MHKQARSGNLTVSDRIDRIVTNRILALPIFVVVMGVIYSIAMGQLPISIGTKGTDWANDVLFGEIVPGLFDKLLLNARGEPVVAHWLYGLIQDGIVAGVGAVLGFVPQILVLCFLLEILEDVGWMGDMAWKATVATVTGLIAKEEVVNTFGVLYNYAGDIDLKQDSSPIWGAVAADFGAVRAYSFMIFNLLCAPCFAAMGAIKREMNNPRWTLGAIGYMCAFAYVIAMIVYQLGGLVTGEAVFGPFTVVAVAALCGLVYLLVRPNPHKTEKLRLDVRKVVAAK